MRIHLSYLLAAILVAALPAKAAPLDPQACNTLKSEYQGLVAAGAKNDMEKGPQWAKSNLQPDRMNAIERLIAVVEQLSFRCGELMTARPTLKEQPKPPQMLNADAAGGGKDNAAGGGKETTAGGGGSAKAAGGKPSSIPPPIRKDKNAALNAQKSRN
jgi:hypothetical protein